MSPQKLTGLSSKELDAIADAVFERMKRQFPQMSLVEVVEVSPTEPRVLTVRKRPGEDAVPVVARQTNPTATPDVGQWLTAFATPGGIVVVSPGGEGGGEGVTDHGALTGLSDDDHTQYLTNARGDARYAATSHGHANATASVAGFMAAVDKDKLNGVGLGAAQKCELQVGSAVSCAHAAFVPIAFTTEIADPSGWHATNAESIYPPAGTYLVEVYTNWAQNGTGARFQAVTKNGARLASNYVDASISLAAPHTEMYIVSLLAGDYIGMQARQTSGSTLSLEATSTLKVYRLLS